ncbi:MAG: CaiB/BaiF CoA-transferase family protein [Chloroflexota bacterium]|nr:CaiB/BaiF CoA-transferase family protein [Chloroflexota bacterium]
MPAPLAGLRILDLSRLLPGPYGTELLAGMGAEVIKVESPQGGDYLRSTPPFVDGQSAHFLALNHGKRSLAVDLKQPAGLAAFLRLVPTADALLEGFRPGTAQRLGVGYDAVHAIQPRLVYCSLSGYGQNGPYRDRAGHDINYIALAGLLGLSGEANGPPAIPPTQIADLSGGMMAALAILAGVMSARATGQGRYVDVSMLDMAVSWAGAHALPCQQASGKAPGRQGLLLTGQTPCYNVYQTGDGGYMSLGAIEPQFWRAFCAAVGRPDLLTRQFDPRAIQEVRALFLTRTRQAWQSLLAGVDCCCEPVLTLDEALAGAQVQARGLLQPMPGAEGYLAVRSPVVMEGMDSGSARPAPRLGQDTRDLLRQVGYGSDEIQTLADAGVVAV